ncbi:MAG: ABC transporter substrate-binding protein, partial [Parcubacteria group bacterium]|nr:ABC transporter substrate-binding protein [Parcubacteria group bacterium]
MEDNQAQSTLGRNILWLVALALVIAGVFAIGKQKESGTIKIGVIAAFTGKAAYVGEDVKVAFDLAADDARAEGILLELVYEDHAGDPKQAVSAAQKLIAQGVHGLIVSMSSPSAAVAPIADEHKLVMLTDSSADTPALSHRYVFKDYVSLRSDCRLLAQKALAAGFKVAAFLPNFESGKECETGVREISTPTPVEFFPMETNDFRTEITKLKSTGTNFLLIYGLKSHIVTMLK